MDKNYLEMFNRFFNKQRMTSTYKPVFLRSILDIGDLHDPKKAERLVGRQWVRRKDGKVYIDLNFVAIRFAKYYWDMEYSFHLRQSSHPHDAIITHSIKKIHDPEKKPPTIEELSLDSMKDFRNEVITTSIKKNVLNYMLTDMPLYEKTDVKTIVVDDDIIEFFYGHKIMIRKGLNNVLTKYLEKLNRSTPQIANKIDNDRGNRQPLHKEARIEMKEWQNSRCFYCQNEFRGWHVDHVIPFNYVFTTDLYNCVLACQRCNCIKSDTLPNQDLFCNVLDRNDGIMDYLKKKTPSYSLESYRRLFESCIEEYNGTTFFSPGI